MSEEKTFWDKVKDAYDGRTSDAKPSLSSALGKNPASVARHLAFFKLAGKLLGPEKKVLHLGSADDVGTHILASSCKSAMGLDEQGSPALPVGFDLDGGRTPVAIPPAFDALVVLADHNFAFQQAAKALPPAGILILGIDHESPSENTPTEQCLRASANTAFAHVFLLRESSGALTLSQGCDHTILVCCK